ncbi:MAG: potassium-transporting ATPase subunit KdpB [Chloroflexota bacterium]
MQELTSSRSSQAPQITVPAGGRGPTPPTRRTPDVDEAKELAATRKAGGGSIFQSAHVRAAIRESFIKLDPRLVAKNPVMFVVEVGALITTLVMLQQIVSQSGNLGFTLQISMWLWFTVAFANFAEAMAEARGKAQADTLRQTKKETPARRLRNGTEEACSSSELRKGEVIVVREGEIIPGDGAVLEGVAYVNEAAITGESAPVLKEPGTDIRSSVTGGTQVVSDTLRIEISADPGETFLDRMIALVEGAVRQKTPNEIALSILLAGLTIVFLLAVATLEPFAIYAGTPVSTVILIALLVCLIPTTIGGLLSAIGIAGMDRVTRFNVLAMSGRAVEAAGDVDVLLLDKTGTITFGNRLAAEILPVGGANKLDALICARQSSLGDDTPEGRSIQALAEHLGAPSADGLAGGAEVFPFTAETRMSGVRQEGHQYFKGAADAIIRAAGLDGQHPPDMDEHVERISRLGGTPLALMLDKRIVGVIYLKDTVKPGMRQRFDEFRRMGIKTIMITGDNPLTAATIADEAGVDDFVAQAKPEDKIRIIRSQQAEGHLVAMTGDGTNDAPALAQADVGLAMNSGTSAAKEAANMVDLDSNPTKLIEVVAIGKQLLITRGAITTFSVANDVAKYFAIIPAAFVATYPELNALNVMKLATPESAILSAVIFNALIIIALVPLALRGVGYRPAPAAELLGRNLLIYGVGGIILPFIGIKMIDVIVSALHLA